MRVVLSGPVTAEVLDRADMLGGITPTEFVVSDHQETPPAEFDKPVTCIPVDKMVGGLLGVHQNDWRLIMQADAVIIVGFDEHLARCAAVYELPCYVE